jgi:15-cis-phytoene synthase
MSTVPAETSFTAPAADLKAHDPALNASFAFCANLVRERARNFYYGLRLTPEPRRSALYAIYAWMREADDLADEPSPPNSPPNHAELSLQRFRDDTQGVLEQRPDATNSPSPNTFWPAFAHTVHTYAIKPAWLMDMLEGLDEDLHHQGYQTQDQLWQYCERVGSVPGMVSVAIWGLKPQLTAKERDAAFELARRRGRAFQLTNILRDISGDHATKRCYIPRNALERHNLTIDALVAWRSSDACRRLVLEQAALAASEFQASKGLEERLALDCAPVLWTMSAIYRGILRIIERDPARSIIQAPARVPTWRKVALATWGMTRAKAGWGAPKSTW